MYLFFRTHCGAVLLAAAVGALCIAPQLWFMHEPGYRGIEMMGADAEEHYVARIQEVYDGYPSLGNVFLPQKDQPYVLPGLGENIVAQLGKALHMTAPRMNVLSKFIFPFFAALLLYTLSYLLFRSRAAALLGMGAALLGDNLMSGLGAWKALLHGTSDVSGFLTYARPINPEVSGVFLFGALILIFSAFYQRKTATVLESIIIGACAGLSWYISPYVSTFLFGMLGLSCVWLVYQRRHRAAGSALGSIVVGTVALVPYAVNYLSLVRAPAYADTALRQGLVMTHQPIVSAWLAVLLAAVLFLWPRRFSSARPFFVVCTLTLIILLNQQIVTGREIQPSHYHWYITKPLVGVMLGMYAVVCTEYVLHRRYLRMGVYVLGALFLLYSAALLQINSYRANYPEAIAAQSYAPALAYLNTLPAGQAVWADRAISTYIPMYTDQNAPNNDYVEYYLVPQQYLVERMLLEYRLSNISPSQILATMEQDRSDISQRLFGVYWRDQAGSYAAIPDSLLEQYAAQYPGIYAEPIVDIVKNLGVTTIIWNQNDEPVWDISSSTTMPISTTDTFKVYSVHL